MIWHFPYYHPETNYENAPETIGVDDGVTSKTKPHSAIREGNWKLLHFHEDGRDELYNLASESGETTDVYPSHEDKGRELKGLLLESLKQSGARLPVPNPRYVPTE